MWLYLDTSALIKLYVAEAEHEAVRRLAAGAEALAVCRVAWVEACSAFGRRARETPANGPALARARDALAREWAGFYVLELGPELANLAGDYAETFALRAYDAIQLAAARELALAVREDVTFACFDRRLNRAARVLELQTPFADAI